MNPLDKAQKQKKIIAIERTLIPMADGVRVLQA